MSFSGIKYQPKISYEMKNLYFYYFFIFFTVISCKDAEKTRGDEDNAIPEEVVNQPSQRVIEVADIVVPDGFTIEAVNIGLSYPVDVTFDEEGNYYIAEAGGHTYGTKPPRAPEARILKVFPNGQVEVLYDKVVPMTEIMESASSEDMEEGLIPPVTGVTYYKGNLYISHRSRYSVYNLETKEFETIINGLPSWGEFLNAKPIFKDEKMYWFLSTQGNSGVIEEHFVMVIDQFNKPDAREIPGEDITLTGQNFWVPTSKITMTEADSVKTGAYAALGETTTAGQVIPGEKIANGAFYVSDLDGSNIKRIAWGFRSSFGYRFSPDGRLITTMNSANPMPPRGLMFDWEPIYEVIEGEWYGWPDFYSGLPITEERFGVKKEERNFVLTPETHRKLLKGKNRPIQPLAKLSSHAATQGMVFGHGTMDVPENEILVAEFGAIVPVFKGEKYHPHRPPGVPPESEAPEGVKYNWPGFKVQQVNLNSGKATDFIYNKSGLPASADQGGGLERPIQLEWDSQGNLYIVDFGVVEFDDTGMNAHPFTGVIWKISKQ
jgi:glucose/arabinose dehydrogenase